MSDELWTAITKCISEMQRIARDPNCGEDIPTFSARRTAQRLERVSSALYDILDDELGSRRRNWDTDA